MLKIGVIGYGYWGPNIVRNFNSADGATVGMISDMNANTLKNKVKKAYPNIATTTNIEELINSPEIDAIAIVTPVFTHFEIAKKALENGKSIFVEKPFTYTVAEAEQLVNLAEKKKLKIMVDHTFLYRRGTKDPQLVVMTTPGNLYYLLLRVNLFFQHDVNAWDLAP